MNTARPLTPKETAFVAEYLIDLNATQAAIRAGYSAKYANRQATQLLAKPHIVAAIDAAKLARSQRTAIDADWVLKRLALEVEADVSDLYDDKGNVRPMKEWPEIWRKGLVAGIDTDELFEGYGDDRHQIGVVKKLRLSDRLRRLELIGKHIKVNAFQETVQHNGMDALADRLERAFKRIGG